MSSVTVREEYLVRRMFTNNLLSTLELRVEWCKSWARAYRFLEEVELVTEEMMRVLRYFSWRSEFWRKRASTSAWPLMSDARAEGHCAYAKRQAAMYCELREHCKELWKDFPSYVLRMQEVIADPSLAKPGEFDGSSASKARAKNASRTAATTGSVL